MPTVSVLFVCMGNCYRSQMAEAFARYHGNGKVEAYSAGMTPTARVSQRTKKVLREKNVRIKGLKPKSIPEAPRTDYLVIMAKELNFLKNTASRVLLWDIPDPSCQDDTFLRRTRDQIEEKVLNFLRKA